MSEVASNGLIEIRVPDIGNYKDVEVIEVGGEGGRQHCRGRHADHARNREGDDGRSVHDGGRDQGTEGAAWLARVAGRRHRCRRSRCVCRGGCTCPRAGKGRGRRNDAASTAARAGGRSPGPVRCGAAGRARGRAKRHDRRAGICACACQSFDSQARARTRRRPHEGAGLGRERPHHRRRREGLRQARPVVGWCCRRRRSRAAARACRRLRGLRTDRAQAAHADPEDLGTATARQLGEPAARHAVRRGRHHRDGAGPREPEASRRRSAASS